MRYFYLRNTTDNMRARLTAYMKDIAFPAVARNGATAQAAFSSVIAPKSPFLLTLEQHDSLTSYDTFRDKMAADAEYVKAAAEFNKGPVVNFIRVQSSLMKCFKTIPAMEIPAPKAQGTRLYELRTYESNNSETLKRKIRMFDEGEIGLFRKFKMVPVFFGETMIGQDQPTLTYMVGFDNLAHREECWRNFCHLARMERDEWPTGRKRRRDRIQHQQRLAGTVGVLDSEVSPSLHKKRKAPICGSLSFFYARGHSPT